MGRVSEFLATLCICFLLENSGLLVPSAQAYVSTITPKGVPLRWKGKIQLNFVGNPMNQSHVESQTFSEAVILGLQRWKYASSQYVDFEYWQGSDSLNYPPNSEYNATSSIYFASNAQGETRLSSNVLGITQVWYDTDSGEILETDIVLNDKDFYFTNDPRDTSGYGAKPSTFTNGKSNVYLQNVITHELGHTLGLSHSGGLQSTMLFMESPEQAHLSCDELTGVHALYPTSDASYRGTLSGTIVSASHSPTFGAHVVAISQQRGTVMATTLTDRSGRYVFQGLEPGGYFIMVEPFYAGSQALPAYFADSEKSPCERGTTFTRTFLTGENELSLLKVAVRASENTTAPNLAIRCETTAGASVSESLLSSEMSSSPILNLGAADDFSFGIADRASPTSVNYYRLMGISGRIEIHALAYSLYSPLHASLSLMTLKGEPVPARTLDPVYVGRSGYTNFDSVLSADLPEGDYLLRVTSTPLQAPSYPAGPVSLDMTPFLVLTGSLNEGAPPLEQVIPKNARCQMAENFPTYRSPSGLPPRFQTPGAKGGSGFCGTVRDSSDSLKTEVTPETIVGWFLPWVFMALSARLATYLHRGGPPVNLKT